MQRFTIPRDLYMGDNALEQLKEIKGERAFIVIGSPRMIEDGTIARVQGYLNDAHIQSMVFQGVEHDPSVATVKKGVSEMTAFQPDWIIGIGGGSPIDAAKAMWIFYEYPELTFAEASQPFSLPELRQKAKFAAVTTTSGTATEVTSFSVITDEQTGIKYPIADYNITPDLAIVDTNLVMGLSKTLVANTGMDALTHAIEAYVSTAHNAVTDALAMKAIEMTMDQLIDSYNGVTSARKDMHIAQCLAGMAFSNAILGIVHAMAHKTGKIFDIPHGCANAIYLPYAIAYNAKTASAVYADIAKRLHLAGSNETELVASLIARINEMNVAMGIPQSLQAYGIDEAVFLAHLESISATAVEDPCTGTNPRTIDAAAMAQLFKATYYGESVNF